MKRGWLLAMVLSASAAPAFADGKSAAAAQQSQALTLTGEIGCAHCSFKVRDKCMNAIRVKEGTKNVVYLIADDPSRPHDEATCEHTRQGTVTGVIVGVERGHSIVKASKIEFAPTK